MPSFSIPFQLLSSTALNSMVISIIGSTISMTTTVAMVTIIMCNGTASSLLICF